LHTGILRRLLKHLEIAEKGLPNNAEIMIEKAAIIVTKGRWENSLNCLKRHQRISPNEAYIPSELAMGLLVYPQYSKAICSLQIRQLHYHQPPHGPYLYKIFAYWSGKVHVRNP
jgi:hypothetical protein